MNEYQKALMDKPSIETEACAICGRYVRTQRHHIVLRAQGGTDGPTVTLCGYGNAGGCHGAAHGQMLHFRYTDRWQYLETDVPVKYEKALDMEGWRDVQIQR
ncbi:MAG: hypothetical protein IJF97_00660 [Eggerthellaceae bacterium]|nr:hypothetical protein [Eggerthellaceae bacterium]